MVDLQQQTISEFLANAERIASSSTSSSSTSSNSPISVGKGKRRIADNSAVGPTEGRRKRSAEEQYNSSTNDESHRRDGKNRQSHHQKNKQHKQQQYQDHDNKNNKNKPLQHDDDAIPMEHVDETLVKAVIDHDEQLNKEVTELFQLDPFFGDEQSTGCGSEDEKKDSLDCDKIKNCMSGCMFLQ
jgi:DNA mismatch repair ATPase MutL